MTMKKLVVATGLSFALLAGCQAGDDEPTSKQQDNATQNEDQANNESANTEEKKQEEKQGNEKEKEQDGNEANKEEESAYPTMADTIEKKGEDVIVTNPDSIYVVANKKRNLPSDFIPKNLVEPDVSSYAPKGDPKRLMVEEAATALEKMFAGAKKDGFELKAVSGYRSYERQEAIFAYNAEQRGEEVANQVSAQAGQSEHQTGLTMDISTPSLGSSLTEEFGNTPEGKWVADHAHEYGFVVRYLKGKEDITGYQYEPWHVRYVGKEAAADIHEAGVTLEEFFSEEK
ncbi:M15 family metallopeptidase [Bacillus sp. RAR_GA_16]|uniref:M15 family metallopeptidase n=1 Tax=Bacillus sp. RAR_GA_16 TaxID=2876774 RepID=UPI001CCAD2E4|nr:M15 family metallopeptidase [Bacillus sp. RAR_GA_16]MCA0174231.1 M15 family metallopeptidase [Bacillus sp. RAR_GA_16]